MGWRPSTAQDAVLIELRVNGPATTREAAERVESRYQAVYQRLVALERRLLLERPGEQGKNGAWLWFATSRDRRRELLEAIRLESLPSDADRELADRLGAEHGVDIRLELDDDPEFTPYGPPRMWGRIMLVTPRGEARLYAPWCRGPCWREGLKIAFDLDEVP